MMPRALYFILALPMLYAGFVQSFWGNDPYLGWMITMVAGGIAAHPIFSTAEKLGLSAGRRDWMICILFLLTMWVSLGVGELPEKTAMMLEQFPEPEITGI